MEEKQAIFIFFASDYFFAKMRIRRERTGDRTAIAIKQDEGEGGQGESDEE